VSTSCLLEKPDSYKTHEKREIWQEKTPIASDGLELVA